LQRQKGVGTRRAAQAEAPAAVAATASQGRTTGARAPAGDRDVGTVTCIEENDDAAAGGIIAIGTVPDVEGTATAMF